MGEDSNKNTQKLNILIAAEILGVILMMSGLAPRELAFFILGGLVFFAIFAPLKQATLLALFSIPLYTALPISEFDSFAVWRVVAAILFLRVLTGKYLRSKRQSRSPRRGERSSDLGLAPPTDVGDHARSASDTLFSAKIFTRLNTLVGMFFTLGMLSLLVAPEPLFGIRKLVYLANIFALFFVVRAVVHGRKDFIDALKYLFGGAIFALTVAYAQFITILFVPLFVFWKWWAATAIPVFYGSNLADLLTYSNTWFAYYEEAEATLRMFSTFPDSHSFALFMVLSLSLSLTFFVLAKSISARLGLGAVVVLTLLSLILSGTRGIWVGALPVFFIVFSAVAIGWCWSIFSEKSVSEAERARSPRLRGSEAEIRTARRSLGGATVSFRENILQPQPIVKIFLLVFILFALLFPVSSQLLRFSQMRQGGQVSDAAFERISTSFSTRELSNKGRIEIWLSTIRSIAERPLLGVGVGNYPVVLNENISSSKEGASAHSLYLDVASEMGIFAGILLVLIFLEILWKALKNLFENKDLAIRMFSGFFAVYLLWVMTYSVVDVVLFNDKVLLLFTALTALLYVGFNNNSGEERGRKHI